MDMDSNPTGSVQLCGFVRTEGHQKHHKGFRVPKNAPHFLTLESRGNCALGGTRTRTTFLSKDFKSFVSTIPPPGHFAYII